MADDLWYLTPDQVAERLQVRARTVRAWVSRGVFADVVRIGGKLRVPVGSVAAFLKSRRVSG